MIIPIIGICLTACFSDDDKKDVETIRNPLREYCLMERQITNTTKDSIVSLADSLKMKIDSLGQGIPAEAIQRLSTKIPECVKLYKWRMKNPRPKKKIEYIKVD